MTLVNNVDINLAWYERDPKKREANNEVKFYAKSGVSVEEGHTIEVDSGFYKIETIKEKRDVKIQGFKYFIALTKFTPRK